MFWIILLALLLTFLFWLLFTPFLLRVGWDDHHQEIRLQWQGVGSAALSAASEHWTLRLKFPFYKKEWPLNELWSTGKKKEKAKAEAGPKKRKRWSPRHPWRMVRQILRSFRVVRFHCDLDTDDYVWNAWLFPLFRLTNPQTNLQWRINFEGRNELDLIIQNRLYRLLFAFLRSVV